MPKKGYKLTEEHREKLKDAHLKRWERDRNTEAMQLRNERISKSNKEYYRNNIHPNKDKTYEEIYGIEKGKRLREQRGVQMKANWKDSKVKMGRGKDKTKYEIVRCLQCNVNFEALISSHRKFCSGLCTRKFLDVVYEKEGRPGYKGGKETRICEECNECFECFPSSKQRFCGELCRAQWHSRTFCGECSPVWQGGIARLPYSWKFNKKLKLSIRQRDDFICQFCGALENGRAFPVHHIDYNKENNEKKNFILLCPRCSSKANFSREKWELCFTGLNEIRHLEHSFGDAQ